MFSKVTWNLNSSPAIITSVSENHRSHRQNEPDETHAWMIIAYDLTDFI